MRRFLIHFCWVGIMALFLAQVEIQIEGGAGWATSLPTWRIEQHWLLDIFWGGRAMTGYHAWMFPFIAMVFHLPLFFMQRWSRRWHTEEQCEIETPLLAASCEREPDAPAPPTPRPKRSALHSLGDPFAWRLQRGRPSPRMQDLCQLFLKHNTRPSSHRAASRAMNCS